VTDFSYSSPITRLGSLTAPPVVAEVEVVVVAAGVTGIVVVVEVVDVAAAAAGVSAVVAGVAVVVVVVVVVVVGAAAAGTTGFVTGGVETGAAFGLVAKQTILLVSIMLYSPTVFASSNTLPSKINFWFSIL
jgi:hypothetical protein